MKYRKKPVVIEAVQYLPNEYIASNHAAAQEMLEHLKDCQGFYVTKEGIVIPTREGEHLASPNDWIIRGIKGEYYPCKPDIFEMTYEAIE